MKETRNQVSCHMHTMGWGKRASLVWKVESSAGESHRGTELVAGGLAAEEIKD